MGCKSGHIYTRGHWCTVALIEHETKDKIIGKKKSTNKLNFLSYEKANGAESSVTIHVEDGSETKVIDVEVCEILVEKLLCLLRKCE